MKNIERKKKVSATQSANDVKRTNANRYEMKIEEMQNKDESKWEIIATLTQTDHFMCCQTSEKLSRYCFRQINLGKSHLFSFENTFVHL